MTDVIKDGFLGVLGGMGPMAGASFMTRLTALTPAERDQQHVPAILWSDPRVPDRTASTLNQGPDPLPRMLQGIAGLTQAGAELIAIPCNTAHLWYKRMAASTTVPILHIVQAVLDDLRRQGVDKGRIGILGTAATLKLGLYQDELTRQGYEWLIPDEQDIAAYCTTSIALVKSNELERSYEPAAAAVRQLRDRGADAVILGCTELPLAIPHARRAELGVAMTDSIDALVLAALQRRQAG
ncbi:MAG: amino acid racemase [Candidimonas sp.]